MSSQALVASCRESSLNLKPRPRTLLVSLVLNTTNLSSPTYLDCVQDTSLRLPSVVYFPAVALISFIRLQIFNLIFPSIYLGKIIPLLYGSRRETDAAYKRDLGITSMPSTPSRDHGSQDGVAESADDGSDTFK